MTQTAPLTTAQLRLIAQQIVKHRARLADVYTRYGLDEAHRELAVFVQVGSRRKFLVDREDDVEFYAICRALGRALDRIHAADLAARRSAHLARGYVSPALAAAAP